MSAFIKAVESKIIGRAVGNYPELSVDKQISTTYDLLNQYRIEMRWTRVCQCEREEYPHMIENFIRAFREAIYGDLRKHMIDLERSILEKRRDKQLEILREMYEEMGF